MGWRLTIVGAVALLPFLLLAPIGAAGSIEITGAQRSGDGLAVSGSATFDDQPLQVVATDQVGDSLGSLATDHAGADLAGASMRTRTSGHLTVRWELHRSLPVIDGMPTGIVYGFTFCVAGGDCWAVDAQRVILLPPSPNGAADLWRCADENCVVEDWEYVETIPATFDGEAGRVITDIPLSDIGASFGSRIEPVTVSDQGPFYTGAGDALAGWLVSPALDGAAMDETYEIPTRRIELAVAGRGLDPASVTYTDSITALPDGSFTTTINVQGMEGAAALYAQACFGSGNCAYTSVDVEL